MPVVSIFVILFHWCVPCFDSIFLWCFMLGFTAEVLDTIYQYADTPTARTAHDFRVASALGGDALIKALEKMEEMPEAENRANPSDGWRWF